MRLLRFVVVLGLSSACQQQGALDPQWPGLGATVVVAPAQNDPAPVEVSGVDVIARPAPEPVPPPLSVRTAVRYSPELLRSRADVREVTLSVELLGALPDELSVEFVGSDGTVYERRAVQVTGSPFELQHFDFTLPVAGTWIDSQRMAGQWSARVFFKEQSLTQPFELTP